jgi:hypothetical protein
MAFDRLDEDAFVERIVAALERGAARPTVPEPAVFAMIVGAGFSHGVVPLVGPLMHETIGDFYIPDSDMSSMSGDPARLRKCSARFWAEYNAAAQRANLPTVALGRDGLPTDAGAAYCELFAYRVANELFAAARSAAPTGSKFMRGLARARLAAMPAPAESLRPGGRFVCDFLRHALATERLNPAHRALATLMVAQQRGDRPELRPFCRTVLTTNFDSLLRRALEEASAAARVSDEPERGFETDSLERSDGSFHVVHVHGSVQRGNPASSKEELAGIEARNARALAGYLATREVIVVGHSGWNDAVVAALGQADGPRRLYWCDLSDEPNPRVARLLANRRAPSSYVQLGPRGADGWMERLVGALRLS